MPTKKLPTVAKKVIAKKPVAKRTPPKKIITKLATSSVIPAGKKKTSIKKPVAKKMPVKKVIAKEIPVKKTVKKGSMIPAGKKKTEKKTLSNKLYDLLNSLKNKSGFLPLKEIYTSMNAEGNGKNGKSSIRCIFNRDVPNKNSTFVRNIQAPGYYGVRGKANPETKVA